MGLILVGFIYSAWRYRGKRGEKFSILNHFISELGEVDVTPAAWAFNLSLILGGLITLPYIVALGIKFGSLLGWLGMAAGLIATLGVASVGLFPMNKMDAHIKASLTYFRAGLAMVFLFGLAILFQPVGHKFVPQIANLLSLLAFSVYASFLLMLKPRKAPGDQTEANSLDPAEKPERPRVWLFPIVEWMVFIATLLWLFGMAFFI
jgi:hypothetical membrane protein